MNLPYRNGVVGVFTNDFGKVLICERSDRAGAWQFPQGGVDPEETEEQAVIREMSEELGTDRIDIIEKSKEYTSYDFPNSLQSEGLAGKFRGQKHRWFKLKFLENAQPDLKKADGEFKNFKWVNPGEVQNLVIDWKRPSYIQGLRLLKLFS